MESNLARSGGVEGKRTKPRKRQELSEDRRGDARVGYRDREADLDPTTVEAAILLFARAYKDGEHLKVPSEMDEALETDNLTKKFNIDKATASELASHIEARLGRIDEQTAHKLRRALVRLREQKADEHIEKAKKYNEDARKGVSLDGARKAGVTFVMLEDMAARRALVKDKKGEQAVAKAEEPIWAKLENLDEDEWQAIGKYIQDRAHEITLKGKDESPFSLRNVDDAFEESPIALDDNDVIDDEKPVVRGKAIPPPLPAAARGKSAPKTIEPEPVTLTIPLEDSLEQAGIHQITADAIRDVAYRRAFFPEEGDAKIPMMGQRIDVELERHEDRLNEGRLEGAKRLQLSPKEKNSITKRIEEEYGAEKNAITRDLQRKDRELSRLLSTLSRKNREFINGLVEDEKEALLKALDAQEERGGSRKERGKYKGEPLNVRDKEGSLIERDKDYAESRAPMSEKDMKRAVPETDRWRTAPRVEINPDEFERIKTREMILQEMEEAERKVKAEDLRRQIEESPETLEEIAAATKHKTEAAIALRDDFLERIEKGFGPKLIETPEGPKLLSPLERFHQVRDQYNARLSQISGEIESLHAKVMSTSHKDIQAVRMQHRASLDLIRNIMGSMYLSQTPEAVAGELQKTIEKGPGRTAKILRKEIQVLEETRGLKGLWNRLVVIPGKERVLKEYEQQARIDELALGRVRRKEKEYIQNPDLVKKDGGPKMEVLAQIFLQKAIGNENDRMKRGAAVKDIERMLQNFALMKQVAEARQTDLARNYRDEAMKIAQKYHLENEPEIDKLSGYTARAMARKSAQKR